MSTALLSAVLFVLLLIIPYVKILKRYFLKAKVNVSDPVQRKIKKEIPQAPGPFPWPVLGNLALFARYKFPFEGFTDLSKQYGDAYSLTLGNTRCLVVNNLNLIREVLNQNGKFFGGRPDFLRYHKLFGGDRNNSLALCDWSQLQQRRRNIARRHCSPRESSSHFSRMSSVGCLEINKFMEELQLHVQCGKPVQIKPLLQQTCANMFYHYMCSMRFDYADVEFQKIVEYFDEIFYEINQGYALDFLPWLAPFYQNHLAKIANWSNTIRKFILERVIDKREKCADFEQPELDFTDALLNSLKDDKNVSRETIIFMLEDFIGGHSAVGNLVMLSLAYCAKYPQIRIEIQKEIDVILQQAQRNINMFDMDKMPFTVATMLEVLRYSSSPIVPHVATEDTIISEYGVTAGTIVFINNYKLNMNDQYWMKPEQFDPRRFLEVAPKTNLKLEKSHLYRRSSDGSDSGVEVETNSRIRRMSDSLKTSNPAQQKQHEFQVKKNLPHFLPFSIGKRTCIGQNLVKGFGFIMLANILLHYDICSEDINSIKVGKACVALPPITFPLVLISRKK